MPITVEELKPYLGVNKTFVETGSYAGDGIQAALDAGFECIHSIELVAPRYEHCKRRFEGNERVKLWLGDTAVVLPQVLMLLPAPATLWLDAHGEQGYDDPVVKELEAVRESGQQGHVIICDDFWVKNPMDLRKVKLVERLWSINPRYALYFIHEGTALVAEPRI